MKRAWLFWLLIIAFVWLVVSRVTEIEKLANTLAQGQWPWIAVAALLQIVYYLVYTTLYQSAFDTVEVKSRVRDLLPVLLGSLFVNVVAPTGGTIGAALFVDDAARRGQPPARAAAGTVLVLATDFGAFALVLIAGLVYLLAQHSLTAYEIIAAAILFLIAGGLSGVLWLGLWRPGLLRRLLDGVQGLAARLAGWVKRASPLAGDWAARNAAEFTGAAAAIAEHPGRLARTLGVALAAHLVDVASLYILFLAFNQSIKVGPLVAGYAIGILFWIVSPTPQGIGVVEGAMALVYASLGVPGETATIVALAFRGLTFWLPLALGFFLLSRVESFRREKSAEMEVWSARAVALLTALMGVVNILSAVTPSLAHRAALLAQFSPLAVRRGSHLAASLAGFALLLLAGNLWRRKRLAWFLTLVALIVSGISHLLKGLDYEEALLAAGLAGWLLILGPRFHARSDPPSIRRGLQVVIAALAFTLAYGISGFYLLDRHFSVNFSLAGAVRQTVVMFTEFYDPGLEPLTGFGRYFAGSIYAVGAATLGYALLALVRPVLARGTATSGEQARARAIVEAYGRSSLARCTLFPDKLYYFSPGGSVVAYAARGRAAVALGDPIGPAGDAAAAIAGFKTFCTGNDWQAAFYQTLPDYLTHYRAAGFNILCIGHEGIVDLATFSLAGGTNKTLRATINRLAKSGYCAEVHLPPVPDEILRELRAISDEWLTKMRGREKRFTLGWFDDEYIRQGAVMVVRDPEGVITAFTNLVPEYQRDELTIDLMRRRQDVEGGTMDFLFVSLIRWAREQGYATFNLGLSALSGVGAQPEDPAAERALHFIYENINQFYNFKGLHTFKEKFHPVWSPRYLIYPGPASLPAVALAINRASSGDSFMVDYLQDFWEKQITRDGRA